MTQHLPDDPGMAVKMGSKSLPQLDSALAGGALDAAAVRDLCAFVDARHDCADFRLVTLLKLLFAASGLSPDLREDIRATVLGFKYWMDEPGDDGMCFWSENHQALFAVCEYLAGQLFGQDKFGNNGLLGVQRQERGRTRLERWLEHRFRLGFNEWLSNTYYEEDAAALCLFIDHADDPALVEKARMVMDLLLLDMAVHRFGGHFVGTSGRCYEEQKKDPSRADVNDILRHFFGSPEAVEPDLGRISSLVLLSSYECPPAIRAIAAAEGTFVTKQSTGLDLSEVSRHFDDPMDVETTGAYLWAMEAFTNVESIDVTARAFLQWRMHANRFLAPLAPFARLSRLPGARRLGYLRTLVRLLNPATQGVAIQRANVYAFRTPSYHLSSAVHHHPGEFGDQQHIWQASLPEGINVFATHPGAPMFDNNARNFSPSYWVGNGRNPDVGQHENVLVALYDVRGRKGYLERERQELTHLHFPFADFDDTRLGPDWVTGRIGDTFIGIRGTGNFEMVAGDELVQRGDVTGYAVLLGDTLDYRDLADFTQTLKQCRLRLERDRLEFATPLGRFEVRWKRGFWRNGKQQPAQFPRFQTPWVDAAREPLRFDIACDGHRLVLDWPSGQRRVS